MPKRPPSTGQIDSVSGAQTGPVSAGSGVNRTRSLPAASRACMFVRADQARSSSERTGSGVLRLRRGIGVSSARRAPRYSDRSGPGLAAAQPTRHSCQAWCDARVALGDPRGLAAYLDAAARRRDPAVSVASGPARAGGAGRRDRAVHRVRRAPDRRRQQGASGTRRAHAGGVAARRARAPRARPAPADGACRARGAAERGRPRGRCSRGPARGRARERRARRPRALRLRHDRPAGQRHPLPLPRGRQRRGCACTASR